MKNLPINKNEIYEVEIIDNGSEGEGIAKVKNIPIFIDGLIKGEKAKIKILKVNSSFAYGKVLEIIERSEYRKDIDCKTFTRCGGCKMRFMDYNKTLNIKKDKVQNLVNKMLKQKIEVQNTIGMENPFFYRNKAQYPVGQDKEGKAIFGVYAERTHNIVEFEKCFIQTEISSKIANFIVDFMNGNKIKPYNEENQKGTVRHIVVKVGMKTNEVMCVLVTNEKNIPNEEKLINELKSKFPNIKTIVKNINNKNTNVILGKENIILYGEGYITDKLGEYLFRISPMSFYQINPIQTEKLYNKAIELAELSKNEVVYDLYCGIGTIGIFASKNAKQVYGIEIIEQAVQDAKNNASLNKIENIKFYSGDVEKTLEELIEKEKALPDVVFVDPPRKGLDDNTIRNLLNIDSKKIVYISCNPATLIRDLAKLEEKYEIKTIIPFDLFPYTRTR